MNEFMHKSTNQYPDILNDSKRFLLNEKQSVNGKDKSTQLTNISVWCMKFESTRSFYLKDVNKSSCDVPSLFRTVFSFKIFFQMFMPFCHIFMLHTCINLPY